MALIKCEDCGRDFSDAATACPGCGRPNKPPEPAKKSSGANGCAIIMLIGLGVFTAMILLVGILGMVAPKGQQEKPEPKSADELRLGDRPGYCDKRYLKSSTARRMPPCAVEFLLSKTLNDPSSFEMDERCKVTAGADAWQVSCDYRARNPFGGMIRESAVFEMKGETITNVVKEP